MRAAKTEFIDKASSELGLGTELRLWDWDYTARNNLTLSCGQLASKLIQLLLLTKHIMWKNVEKHFKACFTNQYMVYGLNGHIGQV